MGWERELTEEEAKAEQERIEEINAACEAAANEPEPEPDPAREGIDWVRTARGDLAHPLQHRCFESAIKFWNQADELASTRLPTRPGPIHFRIPNTAPSWPER